MNRLGLYFVLLFVLTLSPVQGQDPASYQKKAAVALQYEVGQTGKDCSNAKNTLETNGCLMGVAEKTENNFHLFYESLRGLLNPSPEAATELDSSQALWKKYSKSACDAIDTFYRSGTIRISAVTGCRIQLTRSRMQDLDLLYNDTLHR